MSAEAETDVNVVQMWWVCPLCRTWMDGRGIEGMEFRLIDDEIFADLRCDCGGDVRLRTGIEVDVAEIEENNDCGWTDG